MTTSALTFAVTLPSLLVAHNVADHWVQTSWQAANKGNVGLSGRIACFSHICTYTMTTALFVVVAWSLFDLSITLWGFTIGQLVSAVTHYWADRRVPLAWLANLVGSGEFYRFGKPRSGYDDNLSLGTGAYALDQSFHWFWLFVTALITSLL